MSENGSAMRTSTRPKVVTLVAAEVKIELSRVTVGNKRSARLRPPESSSTCASVSTSRSYVIDTGTMVTSL